MVPAKDRVEKKRTKRVIEKRMYNIKKVDGELSTRGIKYSINFFLTNTKERIKIITYHRGV
jgi:hypothetical protein